jgi:hypothetical protein
MIQQSDHAFIGKSAESLQDIVNPLQDVVNNQIPKTPEIFPAPLWIA